MTAQNNKLRIFISLLVAMLMTACGGDVGVGNFTVGGNVSGLSGTLVLQNNGVDDLAIDADGEFVFATELADGSEFSVAILSAPDNQSCSITNNSGVIDAANITDVSVSCSDRVIADDTTDDSGETVDTTSPTVIISPADGDTDVAPDITMSAVFDEPMDASTIDESSFTLSATSGVVEATVSFDESEDTASLTPKDNLHFLTNYSVSLDNTITDLAGNVLTAASGSFTTRDGEWRAPELIVPEDILTASEVVSAVDGEGNVIALWLQYDGSVSNLMARRFDAATNNWSTAVALENEDLGDVQSVRVVMDDVGNAVVVWRQYGGTYHNIWAAYYEVATDSWSDAEKIETNDNGNAGGLRLVADVSGNAVAMWSQFDGSTWNLWVNHFDTETKSWSTAQKIETSANTKTDQQIVMSENGDAIAVWTLFDSVSTYDLWVNRYDAESQTWEGPSNIETNSNSVYHPNIAIDELGNALVVWDQFNGTYSDIDAKTFSVATGEWGETVTLSSETLWSRWPKAVIDTSGNMMVVWYHSDSGSSIYSVWSNQFDAGLSAWGTALQLSAVTSTVALQPEITINTQGNALVSWRRSDGSEDIISRFYKAEDDSWSERMTVFSQADNFFSYKLTLDNDNNALIAIDSTSSKTASDLYVNRYVHTDGWGTAELIEQNVGSIGTLDMEVFKNGSALLLWSESSDGVSNIWSSWFE